MALEPILVAVQALVHVATGSTIPSRVHRGLRVFHTREHYHAAANDRSFDVPYYNIWFVTRVKTEEAAHSTGSHLRDHTVRVVGYYQVQDPTFIVDAASVGTSMDSEVQMDAIIEAICNGIRNSASLHGGVCVTVVGAPEVLLSEARSIDQVPCHYTEIEFICQEEVLISFV